MQHGARAHIAEEDAKRPNRERDCLVGERTRIGEPDKVHPGPAGDSQLQTNPAQGRDEGQPLKRARIRSKSRGSLFGGMLFHDCLPAIRLRIPAAH